VEHEAAVLYLDLLKGCLNPFVVPEFLRELRIPADRQKISTRSPPQRPGTGRVKRNHGGSKRLDTSNRCVTSVVREISRAIWSRLVFGAGALRFSCRCAEGNGDHHRNIWVVDSFEGLRNRWHSISRDANDRLWESKRYLGVSLEQVRSNFARTPPDDQVRFLKGWFKDTLRPHPSARCRPATGRGHVSIHDCVFENLYQRVSRGATSLSMIKALANCKAAVDDFRARHRITDPSKA